MLDCELKKPPSDDEGQPQETIYDPTVAYLFLFAYILAALVWWFISLQRQSNVLAELQLSLLHSDSARMRPIITKG